MRAGRRAVLGAALAAGAARAEGWQPARPIRIVTAWTAGGSADAVIRLVAPVMQQALGQPVIVENRPGASGAVGSAAVAQAAPDGHTLLCDAAGQVTNGALMRNLSFDYATAFAPITQLALLPNLLVVRADSPIRDVAGLVAHLRANPGRESYASTGVGNAAHLAAAMFLRREGLAATHVPYRGSPLVITAMLAGEVLFTFNTTPTTAPQVRDGRLRALAVATPRRLASLPDVPTMQEQGYDGFAVNEWAALFAPAGTPAPAIAAIAAAAQRGLADAEVRQRLALLAMEPAGDGPAAFGAFLAEQRARMARVIAEEGIRLE